MTEVRPREQDPVSREELLESIQELFGPEPGDRSISGWLYSADGWPETGVSIKKSGADSTDTIITARLRFLETDGTRVHHLVELVSNPDANVTNIPNVIPPQPPFEDFADNPSVTLNHVILYTAMSYHADVANGYKKLWQVDNPFANF